MVPFLKIKNVLVTFDFECTYIKDVQYNCSAHCSLHLFIIAISSHRHKKLKEPQFFFSIFFPHIQFECRVICKMFKKRFFYRTPLAVFKSRSLFRNQSNIYEGAFFSKIVNAYKPLTIFTKKLNHRYSTGF